MYVAICARNKGVVGGVPYHFGKGGADVCVGMTEMVVGLMAKMDENEFATSLRIYVGGTDA